MMRSRGTFVTLSLFRASRPRAGARTREQCLVNELKMNKNRPVPAVERTASFAERISRLNKRRQEMIRPVHEHPREYVVLSIRGLAARLHTDPATILRTVRGLPTLLYICSHH